MQRTFTWDGVPVPWVDDTDTWTAGELREVEALARGEIGSLSLTSIRGLMICISVARARGMRVADVDRQLTLGRINLIRDELAAQDREEAERAAAEVAEPAPAETGRQVDFTGTITATAGAVQEEGRVLSPTSAGSEPNGTPPA
jgi:hypothetical protein